MRHSLTVHSFTVILTVHFVEDRCDGLRPVYRLGLHGHVGLFRVRPWPAPTLLAARTSVTHGGDSTHETRGGTQARLLLYDFRVTLRA